MSRRWLIIVTGLVLCHTFISTAVAQDSTVHTLFGNWFPKKDNSSAQQDDRYNQRGSANGSARQQTNQIPPDPANGTEVLPGLGGSPLPKKATQPTTNTSVTKNGTTAPNSAKTAQPNIAQNPNLMGQSARPNSSRQLNVSAPTSAPIATPNATANNSAKSSTANSRQSPSRRSTTHVNPGDLRNELSGSFSNGADASEPVARTARVGEVPSAVSATPATGKAVSPKADTLPTPISEKSATSPLPMLQSKTCARPIESEPRNAAEAFGAASEPQPSAGASRFVRTPNSSSPAATPQATRGKEAFGEALQVAGGGDPNVLASNQTPILNADIRGPKQILMGREAVYRVRLQNQSDIPAEGIVATVRIPAGADVMNATATQGMVQQSQNAQTKGQMQWQIARLDRHAGETLEVRIIPRENRPLELGITWTVAPVGSRAVVEVQEPKLQLEVAGPNEVYFDKPQVFKLTISNPGTGTAENVKIELLPPSSKDAAPKEIVTSHPLGDLAPGASQTVEVELTAREPGKMFVKAMATAEGGLTSNALKEVFCRKPELEVDWRGPATKYAGTLATYFVRVRNPGTAPAEDVTLKASLPEGAEFTSASEGQIFDTKTREVAWHVGTLRPGDDNYMELKCILKNPGANQVKISAATASGNLTDTKTASTNVIALADLKLDVTDPSGPVAVGSPAVYEIRIRNRGANSAKEVNVVGLFSDGIEPEQAEGAMYTVADGRVSFKTIDVPAGGDIVLRIRTHAVQPGTHIFRAEVLCRDLEIKLAAEETTRFYTDDVAPDSGKPEKQAAGRSDAFKSTVR
jgi:uncharacterized repeat protein (TIGR01451 family)